MDVTLSLLQNELNYSIEKHGSWDGYTLRDMWQKVEDERLEVIEAELVQDYTGEHGVARELLQMAVTCIKMSDQVRRRCLNTRKFTRSNCGSKL